MSMTASQNRPHRRPLAPRYWPLALTLCLACIGVQTHAQTTSPEGSDPASAYNGLERQIELGEFEPAIKQLEQDIETIERAQHRYHADLIKPLTLLGDALHGAENYPGALDAYGRAIHLTRVGSGLHSAEQVEGVYREAKVYRSIGDLQQANDREEYAWQVLQKTYGRYSPKLLPGIHHLADWYGTTYNVFAARALYMRAVRIVEANYDEQHPEMVTALRGLANTYRLEKFPPTYINDSSSDIGTVTPSTLAAEGNTAILLNRFPRGEKALKRVIRIQQTKLALLNPPMVLTTDASEGESDSTSEQNNTTADPVALAKAQLKLIAALVELGDWYLLFDRSRVAMQYYTQAEAVNLKIAPGQTRLDFSRPQLLHFPAPGDPRPPKPRYRGERKQGFVELTYSITVRGTVAKLETLGSAPKGLMDYRVRRSMLAAKYRPTFINGTPMTTQGHTYQHKFNYYPSKPDPASLPETEPSTESDVGPDVKEKASQASLDTKLLAE